VPLPFARLAFVQGTGIRVARDASREEMEVARAHLETELERVGGLARERVGRAGRERAEAGGRGGPGAARELGGRLALACYQGAMEVAAAALAGVRQVMKSRRGWQDEQDGERGLHELDERLARYGADVLDGLRGRPCIWLHAASVGEMQGMRALIGPLRERVPEAAIVVSALTRTGRAVAKSLPGVDAAVLFPLDARSVVGRALALLRPRTFLFTETELWPSMLLACAARRIPAVLVSGRMSERSVRRYAWLRSMMSRTLAGVTLCVQSEADARRLVRVGAARERTIVAGSLKAEAPRDENARRRVARVLGTLGAGERALLVGASTHRGEEEALLSAFARVAGRCSGLRLVLAPRHPERFAEVAALLQGSPLPWAGFGDLERAGRPLGEARVLLLDQMGVLRGCLPYARLVFVGGTLAPVGGHSLLEPAADGCAVVFGPHTGHVAGLAQTLLECGGARRVADRAALESVVETLGTDAGEAARVGALAATAARAERGALARHLEIITPYLAARGGTGGEEPRARPGGEEGGGDGGDASGASDLRDGA
jgi:3-deoxy-D-manno-octulosonic-acid transferase